MDGFDLIIKAFYVKDSHFSQYRALVIEDGSMGGIDYRDLREKFAQLEPLIRLHGI